MAWATGFRSRSRCTAAAAVGRSFTPLLAGHVNACRSQFDFCFCNFAGLAAHLLSLKAGCLIPQGQAELPAQRRSYLRKEPCGCHGCCGRNKGFCPSSGVRFLQNGAGDQITILFWTCTGSFLYWCTSALRKCLIRLFSTGLLRMFHRLIVVVRLCHIYFLLPRIILCQHSLRMLK